MSLGGGCRGFLEDLGIPVVRLEKGASWQVLKKNGGKEQIHLLCIFLKEEL